MSGHPARAARLAALPAADAAGLAAAAVIAGASAGAACALYCALAFALLAPRQRLRICLRAADQAGWIAAATLVSFAATAAIAGPALPVPLAWQAPLLVLGCRAAVCAALRAAHRRGLLAEPALVVGAGTFGSYLAGLMRDHPELGLVPAGLVDDGPPRRDLSVPSLGPVSELAAIAARSRAGRVVICFSSECRDEDMVAALRAGRRLRADVCVVPRLYETGLAVPRGCLDEIWGVPLIPLRRPPAAALAAKRAVDVIAAAALALAAAPAAAVIAVAVCLESGRPVFFRQQRLTGDGRLAVIWKFRTVRAGAGADGAGPGTADARWAVADTDCGPVGRWLRATHLDELPQLANVLLGQLSLVGPRPERPYFARRFALDIPRYADRMRMRGGLTGLAQVHGLNGDTSVYDRARFDNYYVEYWSPWLDAVILARTVALVAAAATAPLLSRAGRARAGIRVPSPRAAAWPPTAGPAAGLPHGPGVAVTAAEPEERLAVRGLPLILMYHAVGTVDRDPNLLCVTPGRFAAQMAWLRRHGLRGVAVGTLLEAARAGHAARLVGLTFDDGYAAIADHAVPVLRENGFTATVFALPGRLDGVNDWDEGTPWPLLSASQIAGLASAGMEIGSHSATHAALAGADPGGLAAEVAGSRASLREITGQPVRGFAYPYGAMDQRARDAVRDAGYGYACAVSPSGPPGPYALPRVYAGQADGPARLAAKRLLYRAYFARDYSRGRFRRNNLAVKGNRP